MFEIDGAALDLRGNDPSVVPEFHQNRFHFLDVLKVGGVVLELLWAELLYDGAGSDHRVLLDGSEQLFLSYVVHENQSALFSI